MTTQLIDATALPPAVRHPRIFDTFDALAIGDSLSQTITTPCRSFFNSKPIAEPVRLERALAGATISVRNHQERDAREARGTEYLTWDHSRLDVLFDEVIDLVEQSSFDEARARFATFAYGLERHIAFEELLLFPLFEARAGGGPLPVMRHEHEHIRVALRALTTALDKHDAAAFDGAVEMLVGVLGDHNVKEESVLYPTFDRLTSDSEREDLIRRIRSPGAVDRTRPGLRGATARIVARGIGRR